MTKRSRTGKECVPHDSTRTQLWETQTGGAVRARGGRGGSWSEGVPEAAGHFRGRWHDPALTAAGTGVCSDLATGRGSGCSTWRSTAGAGAKLCARQTRGRVTRAARAASCLNTHCRWGLLGALGHRGRAGKLHQSLRHPLTAAGGHWLPCARGQVRCPTSTVCTAEGWRNLTVHEYRS